MACVGEARCPGFRGQYHRAAPMPRRELVSGVWGLRRVCGGRVRTGARGRTLPGELARCPRRQGGPCGIRGRRRRRGGLCPGRVECSPGQCPARAPGAVARGPPYARPRATSAHARYQTPVLAFKWVGGRPRCSRRGRHPDPLIGGEYCDPRPGKQSRRRCSAKLTDMTSISPWQWALVALLVVLGVAFVCVAWKLANGAPHHSAKSGVLAGLGGGLVTGFAVGLSQLFLQSSMAETQAEQSWRASVQLTQTLHGFVPGDHSTKGISFAGKDLAGADFRQADLAGGIFRDANLRGANLDGADLRGRTSLGLTCGRLHCEAHLSRAHVFKARTLSMPSWVSSSKERRQTMKHAGQGEPLPRF